MNALTLDRDMTATDGYWIGRLAMLVAYEARSDRLARDAIEDFLRSPVPTPWLKDQIREEMRKR